jgi:hypothetical protein
MQRRTRRPGKKLWIWGGGGEIVTTRAKSYRGFGSGREYQGGVGPSRMRSPKLAAEDLPDGDDDEETPPWGSVQKRYRRLDN